MKMNARSILSEKDELSDFTRDLRVLLLAALAVVIGVAGSGIAYVLIKLVGLITNLAFQARFSFSLDAQTDRVLGPWIVLIPVLGGLIVGIMARYGSKKIRGHGIPEALEAILTGGSRLEPKVAVLKPLASAISIGTGGPFGAEGPIIMTGGAFGSVFAQLFRLSASERKTLLAAGAAAGMAGIFATPLAAVLIAVELLLFEWKPRSFIPVALAALVSATMRPFLLGSGPMFPVPPHLPLGPQGMLIALAVGISAGLASSFLTVFVYGVEDLFSRIPLHWMWWPALGGLAVGIGGAFDPQVLGVGYDTIGSLLAGTLVGHALLRMLIGKTLVWGIALGSGTSGGVLAPLLIIGGALGAIEAHWIPIGDPGLWAMVSMAAVMAGALRAPFTAIVFVLELTHGLDVMPALLAACIASHAVTVLLMRRSILTWKITRRGHHVACEYSVDTMERQRVRDVMDTDPATVPSNMLLRDLAAAIAHGDPALTRHHALPIVDEHGRLAGIITRSDILRSLETAVGRTVLEAGSSNLVVAYSDETLCSATARMLRRNVGRMLVVNRNAPQELVGYLGRPNILAARMLELDEEQLREASWPVLRARRRNQA
ncbi:MAG: chloride channel protein [Acidiferrobacterales bacterium]